MPLSEVRDCTTLKDQLLDLRWLRKKCLRSSFIQPILFDEGLDSESPSKSRSSSTWQCTWQSTRQSTWLPGTKGGLPVARGTQGSTVSRT